jgi:hypothetical protein
VKFINKKQQSTYQFKKFRTVVAVEKN